MATLAQKLAKLAFDHPELRGDLMPIIREASKEEQSSVYRPKGNWVLLDLAVRDAQKGKPDPMYYQKDEGYTEVYDNTIKELKRKGRRGSEKEGVRPPLKELVVTVPVDATLNLPVTIRLKNGKIYGGVGLPSISDIPDLIRKGEADVASVGAPNMQQVERIVSRHLRRANMATEITGPPTTTEVYEKEIDHGYDQPLSGGFDVMKRLQDQLLIEQGREPRKKNPRLASSILSAASDLQRQLIGLLTSPEGRKIAREVVAKYAADTDTAVVVNAAVEDVLTDAVAVALDPRRMSAILAKHTASRK